MKLNRTCAVLLAALVGVTGAAAAAQADTASTATTPATTPLRHWGHARGGMLLGTLLRATRQLNLTDAQKSSIKGILASARSAQSASAPDITVLGNPGNPDYASAVQSAKSLASTRIDRESAIATQIYDVLTPAQKTQLPTVLASMKARAAQRRAAWQQMHSAGSVSGS